MRDFDLFVGIDWSGAKGPYQPGLALAVCCEGTDAPEIVRPENARYWSRQAIADWLKQKARSKRILAGIDFAFAYPVCDLMGAECGYFPAYKDSPEHARDLWHLIDTVNAEQPHLYGGAIWQHPVLADYYNAPNKRGTLFVSRRRLTEIKARPIKSPSPTFNCVGPAGVGTGSLAGMRLLSQMAHMAHVWPFDNSFHPERNLTLVEIFPSYYFALSGLRPQKGVQGQPDNLNRALAYFGSAAVGHTVQPGGPDFDEADALISAAALRALSKDRQIWDVKGIALREGWIFGVKSDTP